MSFNGASFGASKTLINGVASGLTGTKQNADGTVTVTYADGKSYTTPNIKGADGKDGHTPTASEIQPIVESVFDEHKAEFVTPTQLEEVIGGALNGTY